jgi:hypothetical protein
LINIDLQGYPETQNPSEAIPWGFDSPSRHHQKYQYPLWNQKVAALVSALYLGWLSVRPGAKVRIQVQRAFPCGFNTLVPLAADFISANYPYLRQITKCAADLKLVVSQQTIKRESTPVDADNVLLVC